MFFQKNLTLSELSAKELDLDRRLRAKIAELAAAEEALGEAFLTDDSGVADAGAVTKLQAEQAAIGRAIAAVREKRPGAVTAKNRGAALALHADAAKKAAEADALSSKTQKLLAQLAELEGVASGSFAPSFGEQSKSLKLPIEAAELMRKAADLEQATIPDSGTFDTEDNKIISDEDIVMGVLGHESSRVPVSAIRSWLAAVDESVAKRFRDRTPEVEKLPRRVFVTWNGDGIDTNSSYIFVPSLANKLKSVDVPAVNITTSQAPRSKRAPK